MINQYTVHVPSVRNLILFFSFRRDEIFITVPKLIYDYTLLQFDIKNHRMFLKKTRIETIRPEDLYIGNTVNILSRQMNFVDYGDDFTRARLSHKKERYPQRKDASFYPNCINFIRLLLNILV